jgi:peptidoglycan hydrolase-like protein with peptidoglycan-binding domain
MRAWIDRNGARYGWRKTEAFSEWWHVNYVGGWSGKSSGGGFNALRKGDRGRRVKTVQKLLRHAGGVLPKHKPHRYFRGKWTGFYGPKTRRGVRRFQKDHGLKADGVVGPKTWRALKRIGKKKAG